MFIALEGGDIMRSRHSMFEGAATGAIAWTLRLEGAVALTVAVLGYRSLGASWWLFAALFLVPDLSMFGYLMNRKFGAFAYNVGHSYITAAAVALVGFALGSSQFLPIALIWAAHIGFDRLMGYGFKYPQAFGATHLGWRGKGEPGRLRQPARATPARPESAWLAKLLSPVERLYLQNIQMWSTSLRNGLGH